MPHIAVCICTYKRQRLLIRLLDHVAKQETNNRFTVSITVVDNDAAASAESSVLQFAATSAVPVKYFVEPRQSICLARNKAVEESDADLVAFIDDDEFPASRWLLNLFNACCEEGVSGVIGPVKRHFDEQPPKWIVKGPFYQRPTHPTGFVIDWREGRTGNVILKHRLFKVGAPPFDPEFHRGGDTDFFRRMTQQGHVFIWCNEAVVYEVVPPTRWSRKFMLQRALVRGTINGLHTRRCARSVATSSIAVALYTIALPWALIIGQHRFMILAIKICDHLGKLLTWCGVSAVQNQYVTD